MRRILLAAAAFLCAIPAYAQFSAGQILTAAQLNSALAAKTSNAAAAITGGTITGLSAPIPLGSGGTGATTATGATSQLQYLQGATGSVARSLTSKFQDTVSVFDFMTAAQIVNVLTGAATIDVSGAIQACINYVGNQWHGGICYNPPGQYLISSTLNETKPYVSLQGAGVSSTVFVTTTNITDLNIGTNPITGLVGNNVLDIGFYHTNAVAKTVPDVVLLSPLQSTIRASFTNGAYGLVMYGGQGVELDRIIAPGNYNPASNAVLNSAQAITLYAASTAPGYTMGVGAVDLPTEVEIHSPYINGPEIQGWEIGLAIYAGEHVTLDGDYYIGQSTLDNVHIEQDANNKLILETTLAPGGYIDGAGRAGVWIGGPNGNGSQYIGQTAIYGTVKGQSGTGLDGIYVDGTARGGSFSQGAINSYFAPSEVSGWSRHGMNIQGGMNFNIPSPNVFGNSFSTVNNGDGILIGANVVGARVTGGKVGGSTYGNGTGNQQYGIYINPSATNVTVSNVDLTGNQIATNGVANAGTSANRINGSPGFNGDRAATVPSMPTSGTAFTNPYGSTAQVLIYGGTVTSIVLNGQQMYSTDSGIPPISVSSGDVLTLTYSSAPSWIWWPQ